MRTISKPVALSAHQERANVMRARDDADNIRASGVKYPRQQAEDMTAPTIIAALQKKPLISGRRPDMTKPTENMYPV